MSTKVDLGPIIITAGKDQTYGMGGGGYDGKYSMQADQQKWTHLIGTDPESAPGGARWMGMAGRILGKQHTEVQKTYREAQAKLDENLKKEVEEIKKANPAIGDTPVQKITHELSLYNYLIEKKTSFLREQILVSHAFYGSDPINKNPSDFVDAMYRLRREGKTNDDIDRERYKSLTAAYTVKLIESVIASLKAQADALNRSLAEAQRAAEKKAKADAAEKAAADKREQDRKTRREENKALLANTNVAAFLKAIAAAEGGGYDFKYGAFKGKKNDPWRFTDTSTHPGAGAGGQSTAAGMYQITIETWRTYGGKMMGLTDFTPSTQDLIAVERLRSIDAIDKIKAGDIAGVMPKASVVWAALPKGPGLAGSYPQPYVKYPAFLESYKAAGGTGQ